MHQQTQGGLDIVQEQREETAETAETELDVSYGSIDHTVHGPPCVAD